MGVTASRLNAGERIKAVRDMVGMTRAELARRAGLTWDAIRNIEEGKHSPRLDTLEAIAAGLGVTLPVLLGYQQDGNVIPLPPRLQDPKRRRVVQKLIAALAEAQDFRMPDEGLIVMTL